MVEEIKFNEVRNLLKQEFFGIDEQIDKVIDSIKTWCTIKDYQVKPSVTCLWGLTGCGKTMLINRTLQLLDLDGLLFDIKVNSNLDNLKHKLTVSKDSAPIFLFDEIQFLKTINGSGEELDVTDNKPQSLIFDLIDLGKVTIYDDTEYPYGIFKSLWLLDDLIENNIELTDGFLIPTTDDGYKFIYDFGRRCQNSFSNYSLAEFIRHSFFKKPFNINNWIGEYSENNSKVLAKPPVNKGNIRKSRKIKKLEYLNDELCESNLYRDEDLYIENRSVQINLFRLLGQNDCSFHNIMDKRNLLKKYQEGNTREFILSQWIKKVKIEDVKTLFFDVKNSPEKPTVLDFSKSLVFIAGNLDEAYHMTSEINSELDADWFHNRTKKLTFIDIKRALQCRFRNEQIARLGTNHIIYPSLNSSAFKQIINKHLSDFKIICKNIIPSINDITYEKSIVDLIYKEGVFPVQGARPIFGAISSIISNQLPDIIKFYKETKSNIHSLSFKYVTAKKLIIVELFDEDNISINTFSKKYISILDAPSGNKISKNEQLSNAVHEVGHAICHLYLNKKIPDYIFSKTKNPTQGDAFVLTSDFQTLTKKNWINRIATSYGGIVAEEIVFGKENVQAGSASDIESATMLASDLILNYGFFYLEDGLIGKIGWKEYHGTMFEASGDKRLKDESLQTDKYLKEILKKSKTLAEEAITKEKELFIALVEYLTTHNKVNKKQIRKFTEAYLKTFSIRDLDKGETFNVECFEKFKEEI